MMPQLPQKPADMDEQMEDPQEEATESPEEEAAEEAAEEASEDGPNVVHLAKGALAGKANGEDVTDVPVSGTIVEKPDGTRCLKISEVDGQPVDNLGDEKEPMPEAAADDSKEPDATLAAGIQAFAKKNSYQS